MIVDFPTFKVLDAKAMKPDEFKLVRSTGTYITAVLRNTLKDKAKGNWKVNTLLVVDPKNNETISVRMVKKIK